MPRPADDLRDDVAIFRERLAGASIVDTESCSKRDIEHFMRQADGYREPKGYGDRFIVRAQAFAGWFTTDGRLRRILTWLDDEGLR